VKVPGPNKVKCVQQLHQLLCCGAEHAPHPHHINVLQPGLPLAINSYAAATAAAGAAKAAACQAGLMTSS
jgi:hypothetical protein